MASYKVQQGDIFGRIGSAIGKGLEEQIPREVEHQRLSQGLRELGRESANLSPIEFLTKAYSTYGITPQMVQSLGEAAKFQRQKNAYGNKGVSKGENQLQSRNDIPENITASSSEIIPNRSLGFKNDLSNRSNGSTRQNDLYIDSGINNYNPTRQEVIPGIRATPEQIQEATYDILASGLTEDVGEARRMAIENDERRLARPKDEQEKESYLDKVKDNIEDRFTKELETRLQKEGSDVFGDISGPQLVNLKRAVAEDIKKNPKIERDKIISKWTEIAYNFAKTKKNLTNLSNQNFFKKLVNREDNFNKLKDYSEAYAEANNSDEFFNILRTPKSENNLGFGMSNQAAAQIAYERSNKIKKIIKNVDLTTPKNKNINSKKIAEKIINELSENDSLLAIAKDLTDRDPFFNERDFFNYFRKNKDKLSPKQKDDLTLGEKDSSFEWGDIFYLPTKGYR